MGIYLCAVDCMYHFAQADWYQELTGGFTTWVNAYDLEIDIESSHGIHGDFQLQTRHIVLGLYETVTDVSAHSRFCEVLSTLSMHRRQIGTLVIQKRAPSKSNATSSVVDQGSPSSNAATYPSGQVNDPDEPSFLISYEYSGTRINSKDIFLAVIAALATAAQYPPMQPFRALNALSASGDCVISILGADSSFRVNYSYITKALRTIVVHIVVVLAKFEEMRFQLELETLTIGQGSISLVNRKSTAQ